MPETYTLWFKNQVKHLRYMKHRRPDGSTIYKDRAECFKQADILLDSFNTVQITKNSEVDEK